MTLRYAYCRHGQIATVVACCGPRLCDCACIRRHALITRMASVPQKSLINVRGHMGSTATDSGLLWTRQPECCGTDGSRAHVCCTCGWSVDVSGCRVHGQDAGEIVSVTRRHVLQQLRQPGPQAEGLRHRRGCLILIALRQQRSLTAQVQLELIRQPCAVCAAVSLQPMMCDEGDVGESCVLVCADDSTCRSHRTSDNT